MKKIFTKWKACFLAIAAIVSMLLGMIVPTQAEETYDKDKTGSITLTLNDLGTDKGNVSFSLYQVGDLEESNSVSFRLKDGLAESGVDLHKITSAQANVESAKKLVQVIKDVGIKADKTVATDTVGVAVFPNLSQAMYLIVQSGPSAYGTVDPFLVAVPYMEDGKNWIYDVKVSPKGQKNESITRSLTVTKKLYYTDSTGNTYKIQPADDSFYVGLFCDESGTIPYQKDYLKKLHFQGTSSESATYENLPKGIYYLYETDEKGTPIAFDQKQNDKFGRPFKCVIGDGDVESGSNQIEMDVSGEKSITLSNIFYKLPDQYLIEGDLSIKKLVRKDGEETTTDDTFYASVYKKTSDTDSELVTVVELKQNDTVTVPVPLDEGKKTTFIIEETDKDGNELDPDNFAYKVSGEGEVVLSMDQTTGSITLKNTVKDKDDSEEETTDDKKDTTGSTKKSKSGKTGDQTPIGTWIAVAVIALLLVVFIVMRKRKSNK